jgi:predicted permease
MRYHLELEAMHSGDEKEAALRFGNRTFYREEVRAVTWYGRFDRLRQDGRYAWRALICNPGFTVMTVLTLALGVGVNAAAFAVLDLVYFSTPAAVGNPHELRRVYLQHFNTGNDIPFIADNLNYPLYREIAEAHGDSSNIALFSTDNALRMGRSPRDPRLRGVYANAQYFDVLDVDVAMGRTFNAGESRIGAGVPVATISHRFWQRQFSSDSAVIGKTMLVGSVPHTIIGVLEKGFNGTEGQAADVWVPLSSYPQQPWMSEPWWESLNMYSLNAIYRTRGGNAERQFELAATQRVRALALRGKRPGKDTLMNVLAGSLNPALGPAAPGMEQRISSRLSGVAVIVLLIACANVINLLLARATRRRHEIALRLALGITRARLIRMLTTEAVLLAAIAIIPALLLAWWGSTVLRSLLMPDIQWITSAFNWRVALFGAGIALAAGLIAGIVPALRASRPSLGNDLKENARTSTAERSRLRRTLIVGQAALSVVLLAGSALFVQSLRNVQSLDIGYDSSRLVFGSVEFAEGERPARAVLNAAMADIATRLQSRPGVARVARTSMTPMQGFSFIEFYTDADSTGSLGRESPTSMAVTPSFFGTVGMRIVRGTTFTGGDGSAAPAEVIVNEAAASRLWPGKDAVGQCMRFGTRANGCRIVVGVVENARRTSVIENEAALQLYHPLGDSALLSSGASIVVRTAGDPTLAVAELRASLAQSFPMAAPTVSTMAEVLEPEYRPWRLGASLFSAFGALAFVVALVGIYSTVSYTVAQRTHEFGVRIALGARLADVLRLVVGEGLRTVLLGVVTGVVLALAAGRLIASMLFGIGANDVWTLISVSVALLASAAAAAIIPAWRAARVNPVTALRAE